MDIAGFFYTASTWIFPVLIAFTLPEAVYGWVAWRLGDDTGYRDGRLTWNLFNHVHPIGTVALPVLMIVTHAPILLGWAKPIPVNFGRMHNPKRDIVTLSCARPLTGMVLALIGGLLVHVAQLLPLEVFRWTMFMLGNFIMLNLLFTVFSLLPIPPLDGGRIAVGLLPKKWGDQLARIEPYGMMVMLGLFFVVPFLLQQMGSSFTPLTLLVQYPVMAMMDAVLFLTGNGG